MPALGQTSDPKALIPGDVASVYEAETELRSYGDALHEAGAGLSRIDTTNGWSGKAAEEFRRIWHSQPAKWTRAGDAFHDAADALNVFASTLSWAQGQAATAISQWAGGNKNAANSTLEDARNQLASAGTDAASTIGHARDMAPPKPGFWSRLGSDVVSALSDTGHFLEGVGETVTNDAASLGNAMSQHPGSVLDVLAGTVLAGVSAGGEIGGFVLDATGIGAALGVPAGVISATGLISGTGLAGVGLGSIMNNAVGPDRINVVNSRSDGGGGGAGPSEGASNRDRPPVDGDRSYIVDNPADLSDTITDIDHVEDGTLWEEKTCTGQDPRMDMPKWIQKNVIGKLNSYARAQQYLQGWQNAPLGLDFTEPGATPEFRAAVEQAVERWKTSNLGVEVKVRWAE